MTHPAKQIIDATAAAHTARTQFRAHVEVNRVRSLYEDEGELPACTVNYGADVPDDSTLSSYHRVLDVALAFYCSGDSETEVLETLLDLRAESDATMLAPENATLGLHPMVWETAPGTVDAPIVQQANRFIGSLTSHWLVRYIMN